MSKIKNLLKALYQEVESLESQLERGRDALRTCDRLRRAAERDRDAYAQRIRQLELLYPTPGQNSSPSELDKRP